MSVFFLLLQFIYTVYDNNKGMFISVARPIVYPYVVNVTMFNVLISEALCLKLEAEAKMNSEARSCTGSLAVDPRSRDIKIANFSITFYGSELLQDTLLELNCGRRYGLVGLNGCGMWHFTYCIYTFLNVFTFKMMFQMT